MSPSGPRAIRFVSLASYSLFSTVAMIQFAALRRFQLTPWATGPGRTSAPVTTRREGRDKFHYLDARPLTSISERWPRSNVRGIKR
jgi:hypothetical protein